MAFPTSSFKTEIYAAFPKPSFIENIAGDDTGNLFVSSVEEGLVYKINADKSYQKYASTNGRLAGIVNADAGTYLCNGWNGDGVPTIYLLNKEQKLIPLLEMKNAMFLNGMLKFYKDIYLICDSYTGTIWRYDLAKNEVSTWLYDEQFTRADNNDPVPALNGIAIYHNTLFVSNTARQTLFSIPVEDGRPGIPAMFLDNLLLDDFDIDAQGTIYASTHIYNSVVAITTDKEVVTIAGDKQGLAGSTAVMLGKTAADKNCLYVTTNGGLSMPLTTGLEDGKVVKIYLP